MRRPIPRPVAATAACLVGFLIWSQFPDRQPSAQAFEKFAKAIVEARSATFEMDATVKGTSKQIAQCYYLAPGKMRMEDKELGMVAIIDTKAGKVTMLMPKEKIATVMNLTHRPDKWDQAEASDLFLQMRELLAKRNDAPDREFKPIGEREIDGVRAVGFRQTSPEMSLTLWGDPTTGLPVLAEMKSSAFPGKAATSATMSHFKLNEDLKLELFDVAPPEGCTVQTVDIDLSKPTEQALVETLRVAADLNDGRFLDHLDNASLAALIMNLPDIQVEDKDDKAAALPSKKVMDLAMSIGRGMAFARKLPKSADAHYAGKGIKRGQADRPIFWYKPEGSEGYRVIYADLTVKEARAAPEIAGAVRVAAPKQPDLQDPAKVGDPAGVPTGDSADDSDAGTSPD